MHSSKRRPALAEFALGLEGLHRFVERQLLLAIHECVFGVLALESDRSIRDYSRGALERCRSR